MTILVIGGTGFVGLPVTRRFRTELAFAEPVPHEDALSRSLAWEREQGTRKQES